MRRQPRNSVLNRIADAMDRESRARLQAENPYRGTVIAPVAVDYAAIAKGQAAKLAAFRARAEAGS